MHRAADFHREIVSEMGELGVLGPTIKGKCNPNCHHVNLRVYVAFFPPLILKFWATVLKSFMFPRKFWMKFQTSWRCISSRRVRLCRHQLRCIWLDSQRGGESGQWISLSHECPVLAGHAPNQCVRHRCPEREVPASAW